jgi:uncharacterized protein
MRQCVVSRHSFPKAKLFRLLFDDERPYVDLRSKSPGRGVYVLASRTSVQSLLRESRWAKRLGAACLPLDAAASDRFLHEVESQLKRRLLDLLSLARRNGSLVFGRSQVEDLLARDPSEFFLVLAEDAAPRTVAEVERWVADTEKPASRLLRIPISKTHIGAALGRDDVAILALKPSALAIRFREEWVRLQGLISPDDSNDVPSTGAGRMKNPVDPGQRVTHEGPRVALVRERR